MSNLLEFYINLFFFIYVLPLGFFTFLSVSPTLCLLAGWLAQGFSLFLPHSLLLLPPFLLSGT